ncbi:HPF/RaiA family ribosome-associated protein [Bacteriovoracaceae bacterium]|nr:HPF/RaiA family ribosome-associated protein [Bacteriovoracaceae bacterium]|tara:strand:+ start:107169 stop:107456 length:288 start_codon:yes stop_codon:yes gene_type:complete
MNLEITFRHLEHTEAIDEKIKDKVSKLKERHFTDAVTFQWTSWIEHDDHITTLKAHDKGKDFFVKASADNLYKTIDMIINKMTAQVEHHGVHSKH